MKKYFLMVMFIFSGFLLYADVKINEIVPKGSYEWVELYNNSSSPVSLDGWKIKDILVYGGDDSITIFLDGRTIGGYDFDTIMGFDYALNNSGDVLYLIDNTGDTTDIVGFGYVGGAPLAPYVSSTEYFSISRITDGVDTDDDARDFNLDWTYTAEAPNDPDSVALGSTIIINEIRPYPAGGGGDSVEFYNPTGTPVGIQGWFISDGDDYYYISSDINVPAGGFAVLDCDIDLSGYMDFSSTDVCYLFSDDSVRVDQLGWYGEYNDFSFQRYPDGAGPNDGYDWISSGGGITLFDTTATWGASNIGAGIEEEVPYGYSLLVPEVAKGIISIQYAIPVKTYVIISIVDEIGRLVSVLVDEEQKSGYYSITVKKGNLPSGLYFVIMESPLFVKTEKLMFMR